VILTDETRPFFDGQGPIVVARAPGRLDVMGGIADYSGSLVLQSLIADGTHVAVQRRPGDLLRVWSIGPEAAILRRPLVEAPLSVFYRPEGGLRPAEEVRAALSAMDALWSGYILGVFYILLAEGVLTHLEGGANMLVHSTVPLGAGVSSSASLEVAAMRAVDGLLGLGLEPIRLARLCQLVEHRVVGAPCGIMDQVACALGQAGHLLALRCQPHHVEGFVRLPPGVAALGLDSGVKHSVGASRYTRARVATFMGRAIIRQAAPPSQEGRTFYLCNITPQEYRSRYRALLPDTLLGAEFLAHYGDHDDPATTVEPDVVYAVRGCTEHPIYENARVGRFARILARAAHGGPSPALGPRDPAAGRRRQHLSSAGSLMYDSHHSYSSRAGLGAPETDLLVRLVRRHGHAAGLFGAKITGGGSGGTVAVLVEQGGPAEAAIAEVIAEYSQATGVTPRLISGTSPGAYETPIQRLDPA